MERGWRVPTAVAPPPGYGVRQMAAPLGPRWQTVLRGQHLSGWPFPPVHSFGRFDGQAHLELPATAVALGGQARHAVLPTLG